MCSIPFRPIANAVDNNADASKRKLAVKIVIADLLIPGDGEPQKNAALVYQGKLILWTGGQADLPSHYHDRVVQQFHVPYLMPGLWDCHSHFIGSGPQDDALPPYQVFVSVHPATHGARLARGCWEALQRGYTSLRDLGGFGCEVAQAISDGTIVGPNIYSSGACISQLAGHGDVFALPAGDALLNLGVGETRPGHYGSNISCLVDGLDECRRAVRLQIRRGAKCIKVLASGGIMSADDNPLYAQFSPEELDVIVAEATHMGRSVAAHAHGKPGILAAVRAGVTTVEHNSFADQECIDLMKEKGNIYVATASALTALRDSNGKGLPEYVWEKAQLALKSHWHAYELAVKSGLTIALGVDTAPGYPMAHEIELAVKAGMSHLEALKAATAHGPLTVQGQVPLTGQLKEGYEADFIGVTENPVEDVRVLQDRNNIRWVWKGGRLYKGPRVGPWGEGDGGL
ncbi:hypothetical protein M409DRAFT_36371 [Zasmidium cellare ATCC 36951]|uniref:Amidohydrolase-related domain-containing protein n=1 Tax=Zasmidium cellare ATCC 36951 TaxID=1080233 RepID=A0A6A6CPE1_ZASCE|nr:uncharacterized protein M409DRAFT_36371 [Zasmidium cellare ATCC 36951]KAF2168543.1 hypothetical protein M409DRAFT_36371 [Zasmidium cellare ATCC 36951]